MARCGRTIELEAVDGDIDDDTLVRFLEYAYTGGYSVPDPVNLRSSSESMEVDAFASKKPAEADPFEVFPVCDYNPPPRRSCQGYKLHKLHQSKAESQKELESQRNRFSHLSDPVYRSGPGDGGLLGGANWLKVRTSLDVYQPHEWVPPENNDEREDFTSVFLRHAKVYKFADRYECSDLMKLCTYRLHLTLSQYQFHKKQSPAIVNLI